MGDFARNVKGCGPSDADWVLANECEWCGRHHRSWYTAARCRWRRGLCWVAGNPPTAGPCWALVSYCRHPTARGGVITVTLHESLESAEKSKRVIDRTGCGGSCRRDHEIYRGEPGEGPCAA
jgi:hypothetical protein